MIIVGITGTLGAGKGTVVSYLCERYGFAHYSVRGFLTEEIQKRGLPVNRDSMTLVANELRAARHPGWLVEQLYERAVHSGGNAIIESIRTVGEIDTLRSKGQFFLIAVDADIQTRYKRITARNSQTDEVSFERFSADEQREMQSEDPNKQHLIACMAAADVRIVNNGTPEDLYAEVDKVVQSLGL